MPDPPLETASFRSVGRRFQFWSNSLISLSPIPLDMKLQKASGHFKLSLWLDEREVDNMRRRTKEIETDSKATSSLQLKGNRNQLEFNSQLLDCLDL